MQIYVGIYILYIGFIVANLLGGVFCYIPTSQVCIYKRCLLTKKVHIRTPTCQYTKSICVYLATYVHIRNRGTRTTYIRFYRSIYKYMQYNSIFRLSLSYSTYIHSYIMYYVDYIGANNQRKSMEPAEYYNNILHIHASKHIRSRVYVAILDCCTKTMYY